MPANPIPITLPHPSAINPPKQRIDGYDFARAIAIFGMVIVNFKYLLEAYSSGPEWLSWIVELLDGRSAATFVVLAGIGFSLLSSRARITQDPAGMSKNRKICIRRAFFLFAVGLLFARVWEADILHFYGIYMIFGALLLSAPSYILLTLTNMALTISILLLSLFLYHTGLDWEVLLESDIWTLEGMIRNIFINGYYPVFPWIAYFLTGMWFGRQNLMNTVFRKKLLIFSILSIIIGESAIRLLSPLVSDNADLISVIMSTYLLDKYSFPVNFFYLISAGGSALVTIILSINIAEKAAQSKWIRPFLDTGRLALTLYIAHILICLLVLAITGRMEVKHSLWTACTSAFIFCIFAVTFAYFWTKRFKHGPLEAIMRWVTN
ncbi:MAG: DUF418 domain-containing protein [Desulfobacterales bacterium]|nr:DUF418 domain-containing protein [Desulfobacterales bacterium]